MLVRRWSAWRSAHARQWPGRRKTNASSLAPYPTRDATVAERASVRSVDNLVMSPPGMYLGRRVNVESLPRYAPRRSNRRSNFHWRVVDAPRDSVSCPAIHTLANKASTRHVICLRADLSSAGAPVQSITFRVFALRFDARTQHLHRFCCFAPMSRSGAHLAPLSLQTPAPR